ncbi:SAV_6107 family HEPN domain-containing protein [Herbidospora sp. RD11066]
MTGPQQNGHGAAPTGPSSGPKVSRTVLAHLTDARACLAAAALAGNPADRYIHAHMAALRSAAAILAARPQPIDGRRRRLRSAWELLPEVQPELSQWAAYFAVSAKKRAAAEAGLVHLVSAHDAEELIVEATAFVTIIESTLGVTTQETLPMAG